MTSAPRPRATPTLASAVAAAPAEAPVFAACALVGSAIAFNHAAWAATAGFLADALLLRTTATRLPILVAFGCLVSAAPLIVLVRGDVIEIPWSAVAVGAGLFAGAFASSWTLVAVAGLALYVFAVVTATRRSGIWETGSLYDTDRERPWADMLLVAWTLAIMRTSLVRRRVTARLLAGAAALMYVAALLWGVGLVRHIRRVDDVVDFGLESSGELVPVFLAPIVGAAASELHAGEPSDQGTRFIVWFRGRPWTSAFLVAFLAALLTRNLTTVPSDLRLAWLWDPRTWLELTSLLPIVPLTCAFLARLSWTRASSFDALAPWLATALAALVMAGALILRWGLDRFAGALGASLVVCGWPVVVAAAPRIRRATLDAPFAAFAYPAVLFALPVVVHVVDRSIEAWTVASAATLVLAPLAFHAVVETHWPARTIIVGSTLLGLATWATRPNVVADHVVASPESAPLVVAGTWMLIGVLVVLARRAHGMTVVPDDHPVAADFGDRRTLRVDGQCRSPDEAERGGS